MTATVGREYQRCTATVMGATDPEIEFDESGVSSHARTFNQVHAPMLWRAQAGGRSDELEALVDRTKRDGKGKQYDVVVGVSGGLLRKFRLLR